MPQTFTQNLADSFWRAVAKRLRKHLVPMPYIHGSRDRFFVGKNVILNNATINTRGGDIRIADHVMFGHNVSVLTGIHDYSKPSGQRVAIEDANRHIVIEQGAWIASNVTLVGPVTIGEEAVVAAGSVVVKDVPARTIVAGNPAKVIRYLLPEKCARINAGGGITIMQALFFLRHYNDIDHITPVMWEWMKSGHRATAVVYSMPEYLDDYRLQFLKRYERFSLHYIDEFLDEAALGRKRQIVDGPRTEIAKDVRISDLYNEAVLSKIIDDISPNLICFDWIMSTSAAAVPVAQRAAKIARERNLPIISLPHGDSPHSNEMISADDLNFAWRDIYSTGAIVDSVVVPNELCAKRYRPFMSDDRIAILGSPRYNDSWLKEMDGLTPTFEFGQRDSLNIVLFLRSPQYPIFWQEVVRTIRMLTQQPGVKLVVKHHTRPSGADPLRPLYDELEERPIANLKFAFDETHSGALLRWSDVVMDVATSVSFEALKANKPVLAMEYLHAGYSTIARYIPSTEMRCRDDVLHALSSFAARGTDGFYRKRDRLHFMDEMIDYPDAHVLPRYVRYMEHLVEPSAAIRSAAAA